MTESDKHTEKETDREKERDGGTVTHSLSGTVRENSI